MNIKLYMSRSKSLANLTSKNSRSGKGQNGKDEKQKIAFKS